MTISFTRERAAPADHHLAVGPVDVGRQRVPCFAVAGDLGHRCDPHAPLSSLAIEIPRDVQKLRLQEGSGIRGMEPKVKRGAPGHRRLDEYLHLVEIIVVPGPPEIHAFIELVHAGRHSLGIRESDASIAVPDGSDRHLGMNVMIHMPHSVERVDQ